MQLRLPIVHHPKESLAHTLPRTLSVRLAKQTIDETIWWKPLLVYSVPLFEQLSMAEEKQYCTDLLAFNLLPHFSDGLLA